MKGKITAWGGGGGGEEEAMVTGSSKIRMSGEKVLSWVLFIEFDY